MVILALKTLIIRLMVLSTQNYQTIWSLICWSDDVEDGGNDPELFWELGGGGTTLFEFVVAFRFEPEIRN